MATSNNSNNNASEPPSEEAFTKMFDEAMKCSSADSSNGRASKLDMSRDEQQRFASAMQDPAFRSLLNEYMTEISDPANRAETEQYLAQLEREQKVPDDKVLVRPTPGFVVKTRWREQSAAGTTTTQKLFVNVCSSDKLEPPSSTPVQGSKAGTSWHLPYSVGPERFEPDRNGSAALAFDVCFHPTTLSLASRQRAFRDMVVTTSLDAIEKVLCDTRSAAAKPVAVTVTRTFHILKGVTYKTGSPVTMCLRKPAAAAPAAAAVSESVASSRTTELSSSSSRPLRPESESTSEILTHDPPIDIPSKSNAASSSDLRLDVSSSNDTDALNPPPLLREVSTTKTTSSATATPGANTKPTPALQKIAFKLVHRGQFELLNHMQREPANALTPPTDRSRPKALVLDASLPTLASAKGVDLDVSERALRLSAPGYEPLTLQLPFPVLEAKGTATFDKKTRSLIVTLPVQPPPATTPTSVSLVVQEEDDGSEGEDVSDTNAPMELGTRTNSTSTNAVESVATQQAPRIDDGFAMLRETALMVQHDPLYRRASKAAQATGTEAADTDTDTDTEMVERLDDLPPLESCSEDEDEDEDEDEAEDEDDDKDDDKAGGSDDDLVVVDMAAVADSLPKRGSTAPAVVPTPDPLVSNAPTTARPPIATKETATCVSFIVGVANVDATTVQLDVPTTRSIRLRYSLLVPPTRSDDDDTTTADMRRQVYEVQWDDFDQDVDPTTATFDVASENMVVILTKKVAAGASQPIGLTATESTLPVPSFTPVVPVASLPPAMRFQNQFLYDLD